MRGAQMIEKVEETMVTKATEMPARWTPASDRWFSFFMRHDFSTFPLQRKSLQNSWSPDSFQRLFSLMRNPYIVKKFSPHVTKHCYQLWTGDGYWRRAHKSQRIVVVAVLTNDEFSGVELMGLARLATSGNKWKADKSLDGRSTSLLMATQLVDIG